MLRDRLFVEDPDVPDVLDHLRASGVAQALVLSTCDRVEVQAVHADHEAAAKNILRTFAEHGHVSPAELEGQMYVLGGDDAVRHIFRVASALDSMTVGEPQVLGQVKASHQMARDAGMSGSELEGAGH